MGMGRLSPESCDEKMGCELTHLFNPSLMRVTASGEPVEDNKGGGCGGSCQGFGMSRVTLT